MQLEKQNSCVRLQQRRATLEVSSPLPQVWRIRLAPLADLGGQMLPPKQSFAVVGGQDQPLTLEGNMISAANGTVDGSSRLEVGALGFFTLWDGENCIAKVQGFAAQDHRQGPLPKQQSKVWLEAPQGQQYYGFGEKVGPLNKRGMSFTFWNTDVVPHHPDSDPLYQSIPFFMGLQDGQAWGFFLDESSRSSVDIAETDPDTLEWTVEAGELDLYLICGPTPAQVLERYTALTGRTPLPPLWSLGVHQSRWGYQNEADIRAVIDGYRSRNLPLEVVHLDIDYMNGFKVFTFDQDRFPDVAKLSQWARSQGVRLVCIVDPGVKAEAGYAVYDQALERDFLVKTWRGEPIVGEVWPDPAVWPDFSRSAVQNWWGDLHQSYLEGGIAGIWNDMNEPSCFSFHSPHIDPRKVIGKTLPDDARHGNRTHLEIHNVYALGMAQATFEGLKRLAPEQRPFVLTRAGYAGIQRYSAVWTGDNSSHWEHLELSISMLLGLGISGVPFVGSDIGGFASHSSGELLLRWTQAGVFYPLMRNHSAQGTEAQEPWRFGEQWLEPIRLALELRYRLLPVLYSLMEQAEQTGTPALRPMFWEHPTDGVASSLSDQFYFGPAVLVAPVLRPHHRHRSVYFPSSDWMRLDTLEQGARYAQGWATVSAPLEQIPMFLRPGGILPLAEVAQHSTHAHWQNLTLMVNACASGETTLLLDDGEGYGERQHAHFSLERYENHVVLKCSEGFDDAVKQIVFLGLPMGSTTHSPAFQTEDGLYVDVSGEWDEIRVDF